MIDAHISGGSKTSKGLQGGAGWLTAVQHQDLQAFLISEVWQTAARFDGRGRLAGWTVWIAHKRVVDWLRVELGSTRHAAPRPTSVSFDDTLHADAATSYDDYPSEERGRELNREGLSAEARDELALLELSLEANQPLGVVARELGVPASVAVLRREAVVRS